MKTNIKNLRLFIREVLKEEAKSTKKYDDNKNLKGKQSELPDHLQKGIIKKADPNDPDLDDKDMSDPDLDEELLGEPDLSSEEERAYRQNEFSALGVGGMPGAIRGYQAPLGYSHKDM